MEMSEMKKALGDEKLMITIPTPAPRINQRSPSPRHGGRCMQPPPINEHPNYPFKRTPQPPQRKARYISNLKQAGIDLTDKDSKEKIDKYIRSREVLRRTQPSTRLKSLMEGITPNYSDEADDQKVTDQKEDLYIKIVEVQVPKGVFKPENPYIGKQAIEQTLYEISTFGNEFERDTVECFGLTSTERKMFCLRLHLLESSAMSGLTEGGWERFAESVIEIDADEIRLIDEYNARHNFPVMEIVLRHWKKLAEFGSQKVKMRPSKESIISVLREMNKLALLQYLNWI